MSGDLNAFHGARKTLLEKFGYLEEAKSTAKNILGGSIDKDNRAAMKLGLFSFSAGDNHLAFLLDKYIKGDLKKLDDIDLDDFIDWVNASDPNTICLEKDYLKRKLALAIKYRDSKKVDESLNEADAVDNTEDNVVNIYKYAEEHMPKYLIYTNYTYSLDGWHDNEVDIQYPIARVDDDLFINAVDKNIPDSVFDGVSDPYEFLPDFPESIAERMDWVKVYNTLLDDFEHDYLDYWFTLSDYDNPILDDEDSGIIWDYKLKKVAYNEYLNFIHMAKKNES